jgi:tRNA dimethylallyltransferase
VSTVPQNVIAIVGATGTGKSALADALAVAIQGETVGADSMQVYRGMDIGTAKTPVAERSVPYHCIDLVDPDTSYTVALYQREARRVIDELFARACTPVLCGGSGLYVRAALDPFELDEHQEENLVTPLRATLQQQAEELGPEAFHELLRQRDPKSAELIHPNNVRRVIRAFEFLEQGTSYAAQHAGFENFEAVYPTHFIGITVEAEVLYQSIERRVDKMIANGLLNEVQDLLQSGFRKALTAQQAIGYKELVAVIEGRCQLDEAIAEIKQSTRRYAKRQRTWFKRDPRIQWLDATEEHRALLADQLTNAGFTSLLLSRAQQLLP